MWTVPRNSCGQPAYFCCCLEQIWIYTGVFPLSVEASQSTVDLRCQCIHVYSRRGSQTLWKESDMDQWVREAILKWVVKDMLNLLHIREKVTRCRAGSKRPNQSRIRRWSIINNAKNILILNSVFDLNVNLSLQKSSVQWVCIQYFKWAFVWNLIHFDCSEHFILSQPLCS